MNTNHARAREPQLGVSGVATRDNELLLVRRGHGPAAGVWSIPGGRVRFGEDLREALVREFLEETALEVVVDAFLGWIERIDMSNDQDASAKRTALEDTESHYVILTFEVTLLDQQQVPRAGDDAAEAAWVHLEDLAEMTLTEGLLELLIDADIISDGPTVDIQIQL